jgi:hypothetical protein
MKIRAMCHDDYVSLLPAIFYGEGWIMFDFMWWVIEIY